MGFKPTHTNKHLKKGHLQNLVNQAEEQEQALSTIKSLIPAPINQHVSGVTIKNRIATLLVENQLWATKLRYMTPALKEQISEALQSPIYALQIKVMPFSSAVEKTKPKVKKTPTKVPCEVLYEAAVALDDPELSEILARIATRASSE
ncbi:MAG: DUF721 domain-containing protein [Methylococcales bacterium]|jgi:hypothetical protein|nr:DUF721 domain-containing protein [Methylococcales bacterium]MBT7446085.1 DUF721 domain-containing protein [Methylococcales bacterium]